MTIYLDSDYGCHTENHEGYMQTETDFFDGKCQEYIEGFRLVPNGSTWIRSDGKSFSGFLAMPLTDISVLKKYQQIYERQIDMENALAILGVTE